MRKRILKKFISVTLSVLMLLAPISPAFASSVDTAVVDVTAPTNIVSLAPGDTSDITINLSVTGNQEGTATFQVYQNWTLVNGVFSGSNPVTKTVDSRGSQDAADLFTINGKLTVANSQPSGNYNLVVGVFGITNSNQNGGKLAAGQTKTYSVTVTRDNTPPSITAPADITQEATAPLTPVVLGTPIISDNISSGSDLNISNNAPSAFPVGDTNVIWTVTDKAGNSATAAQKVTITDKTAPNVTAPGNKTIEATGPLTSVELGEASANDLVSFGEDLQITNNAPAAFPVGETAVEWKATDKAGNSSTAIQQVIITDETAPSITVPAAVVKEATGPLTTVALGNATASDLVSSGDDLVISNNAPELGFTVGEHTVTWTVSDKAGNHSSATQKVTIKDTTPPVLTAPADVKVEATAPLTKVDLGNASAFDLVSSGSDLVVSNDAPKDGFTVGVHTVTWTVTDAAGNSATATQQVTVVDTTAPTITAPADVVWEATGPLSSVGFGYATATDLVSSGDELVISNDAPVGGFAVGTYTVTWTATDAAGNQSQATQTVTITDTTAPTILAPNDILVVANGPLTKVDLGNAIATDLVSSGTDLTVTNNAPVDGFFPGKTVVTWIATDKAGNQSIGQQSITVVYGFSGFFQPISMGDAVVNNVKAGSAIPVKFSLHGYMGMNIFEIGYPKAKDSTTPALLNNDNIQTVTAGNSGLSYDPSSDQYTYVWKTDKAWAGTSKQLVIEFADGKTYTANFKFAK